jgi:DNA-binding NarL/FixJ family response regulator
MLPTRLLIVDDHAVVRLGIKMVLNTRANVQVVGEATDGQDAIRQVEELQPDLVLMDLVLPQIDGIEIMARIKKKYPIIKVIVLTASEDILQIKAAISAGADGYLLKDADADTLLTGIEAVQQGDMALHPRVARHLIKNLTNPTNDEACAEHLTRREKEVLQLLAQGLSNKEMAGILGVRTGTIKIYVSNILGKLDVTSRTEAAVWALQIGLVSNKNNRRLDYQVV